MSSDVDIVDGMLVGIELVVGSGCIASHVGNDIAACGYVGMGILLDDTDICFCTHSDVGGNTFD